jgi:hypothetical protein
MRECRRCNKPSEGYCIECYKYLNMSPIDRIKILRKALFQYQLGIEKIKIRNQIMIIIQKAKKERKK